jgi:hypothetical protein
MKNGMNNDGAKARRLIAGGVIGVALGAAFVVTPVHTLALAVPAGFLVGAFLCGRNTARLPAAGLAIAIVVSVIAVVATARPDPLEKRPASLPSNNVTVAELVQKGAVQEPAETDWGKTQLSLPSTQPTVREIMQAINDQTAFKASVFRCGTGATVWQDAWIGRISIRPKQSEPLVATFKP